MSYERFNIEQLDAYTPGEQPTAVDVVKLNTNENPYPPTDAVMQAIRQVTAESLRRYPSPRAATFRQTAAEVHGVTPDHILATNGGDELLRMAVTTFCQAYSYAPLLPGDRGGLGETLPTYSLYDVLAGIHNTPVVKVPLNADWSIAADFAEQLNDAGCRLALVVNPHAPSGRLETVDTLRAIARAFRGVLLIDEAYVNFAARDTVDLVRPGSDVDNVMLLRTMSKGYSLAGLRFGYAIGHPKLIAAMDKCRDSYNTDALAQAAATAALRSRDIAAQTWAKVIAERMRVTSELRRRGCEVPDSQSNFILAAVQGTPNAREMYQRLKDRNILVRYFDQERLRDKLRITIGTPAQNDALLAAWDQLTATRA
ncbi:MAG: histidinol-phosphate transaminase [Phycisphaeraceae bacterium]|nr:histidinol-phosphate transaminase [Phycisphaeraceae bacterium]